MTWPFENNTNGIVKNLAKRNLKSEKRRNIMVIISVVLAAFLISLSGLVGVSLMQTEKKKVIDTYEATYVQVDESHIEELKQVPEFARVGEYYMYGKESSTQGFNGFFAYADKETLYMARSQMKLADGDLPIEKNEIVVSKEWLSKFFPDCHIGDSVTLDTESFSGEYTISGILDTTGQEKQNMYSFLISKEMLEQCKKYEPDGFFAYVHLKNVDQLDGELIKSYVQKIKEELQIPGVGFQDAYFRYIDGDISMENVLLLMAFAGIVLVGGCVVIQSIFRISIIDKIKSYGQLRTIGATKKQIMRIVKKEGHSLGWKGMSIGILLGLGVTLLLFPRGFSLLGYLLVIGCTVLICWTMICLSIRKPVKLAANISPVEAVRFTSPQKKIKNRTKRKKISPCSLGMLNFRRDWKKTVSIMFSLSLGGILLLAVSSLLILQSPEKLARQYFKNGDYKIYMDSDKEHINLLKQGNPLNEELKQEILDIDGVEEILVTRKSAGFGATSHEITARGVCDMITKENRELLTQAVVEGSMPDNNGILLPYNYRGFDGKEKLGETIELSLGEKTIPVTISGYFDAKQIIAFASGHGSIGVDGPMMFLPEELFQELIPDVTNFDYSWDIVCNPDKSEKVGKALENLVVSHTDIGLDTFEDRVDSFGYMNVVYGIMQVISWFIFLFGVINLINTTLSNQYSRRQENSVLCSVGLAPKQLTQMAVWEGMGYVVSSILLMLAIGLPITLLVWRKFSISSYAGRILPYEFPWLQMGVYVVVLVTVEFILSVWTIRRQKKQSLIEQMRAME
ncbi:ABC transporter permease [[Ruminococcus] torques]|uniref:ABC transporter permease n=1 Tax=[Ruminococcus] torques TaxID=33039 RepID=UPI0024312094|nr:ABC transporter permease [[Ruminococcus] torques]